MAIKTFSELQQNQQFYLVDKLGNRVRDMVWVKVDGTHGEFQGEKRLFTYDHKVIPAGQVKKKPGEVDADIVLRPPQTLVKVTPEEGARYFANAKAFIKNTRFYSSMAWDAAMAVAEYMAYLDGKTLRDWE